LLTAYFDDSGTHINRNPLVVVYAGFIGLNKVWEDFEPAWQSLLTSYGIKTFHLTKCDAAEDEFQGWSRAKRDLAIADFRNVILNHDLWGISATVVRADWDELVVGDTRKRMGEPDEFCALMCAYDAMTFQDAARREKLVSVVFDQRAHRSEAILRRVNHLIGGSFYDTELVSVTFAAAGDALPLQAADMLACETYRYAQEWLRAGCPPDRAHRPHFQRFLDRGKLKGGIANRKVILDAIALEQAFPPLAD
jgi:hypothetical protein